MRKQMVQLMMSLGVFFLLVGTMRGWAQKVTVDEPTREALVQAVNDERHAQAFYQAVMRRHSEVRPFSNIVKAEKKHEEFLLDLFKKYDLTVPANPWQDRQMDVPDTLKQSCAAAVKAEEDNIALYDRLLKVVKESDIRDVFGRLRAASLNNHLPAFKRCADGAGGRRGRG